MCNMLITSGNILNSAAQNKDSKLELDSSKPFDTELVKLGHEWEYFDSVCDQLYSILDNLKSTVELEGELQPPQSPSPENIDLVEPPVEEPFPDSEPML
ncbi:hypothetical protein K7432_015934 [Basidiobolus ranarum]|uniref:Uncharacterized protein n=1 Tax=Basidiobolus ranarum TaxID=34480 RepID=A0ABR2VND2_9FUNG